MGVVFTSIWWAQVPISAPRSALFCSLLNPEEIQHCTVYLALKLANAPLCSPASRWCSAPAVWYLAGNAQSVFKAFSLPTLTAEIFIWLVRFSLSDLHHVYMGCIPAHPYSIYVEELPRTDWHVVIKWIFQRRARQSTRVPLIVVVKLHWEHLAAAADSVMSVNQTSQK